MGCCKPPLRAPKMKTARRELGGCCLHHSVSWGHWSTQATFWLPGRHPRHRDVVRAGEEASNVTVRHPAWGSPHRSRMGRVAAGSQVGDGHGSRRPQLPILGPSWAFGGAEDLTPSLAIMAGKGEPLSPQTLALGTCVSLLC